MSEEKCEHGSAGATCATCNRIEDKKKPVYAGSLRKQKEPDQDAVEQILDGVGTLYEDLNRKIGEQVGELLEAIDELAEEEEEEETKFAMEYWEKENVATLVLKGPLEFIQPYLTMLITPARKIVKEPRAE